MSLNSEVFCPNKMEEFCIIIFVSLFASNSLDKAESVKVKLEETPLKTFDEIFGEGWWAKDEAEDLKMPPPTNFGQNVHRQIDRQNTQIGQIEPNSTDQNPPLIGSDHSEKAKNGEEQKEITSNEKRTIIEKFHAMRDEFKQKGKYSDKEWIQIEVKIANNLKNNRKKIYKWKKQLGLSRKMHNFGKEKEERKHLIEKFDQMKAELMRAGIKNSYHSQIDKSVAKELGLSFMTIYRWKRKLGQTKTTHKHTHSEQKELMKCYYEIKDQNHKIIDADIAKMLKIGSATLVRWKRQFKRQQFHLNSVDGHSVEENAAANVQEIGNSNSGSI